MPPRTAVQPAHRRVSGPTDSELSNDPLVAAAEAMRGELVALTSALARVDSPSGGALAELEHAEAQLAAELLDLGARIERHGTPAGAVLEAVVHPRGRDAAHEGDTAAEILVLCHYDTVWPTGTAAERPPRLTGDTLHGPGVYDMRGGIVAALGALRLLLADDALRRPVRLLLTPDEETGSAASRAHIERAGRQAKAVLVTEPPLPGGALKTQRKGWATYRVEATGRAAHAGIEPEKGVSAIDELVDALTAIRALATPETTINVGVIEGGRLPNVVADRASATLDVRATTTSEQARVHEALANLSATRPGATVAAIRVHDRPPMERTPEIAAAAARAKALAAPLGIDLGEGSVGGTSDANFLAPLGVAVLDGLGPEGAGAHAVDERISIDSLVQRTALIARLVCEL